MIFTVTATNSAGVVASASILVEQQAASGPAPQRPTLLDVYSAANRPPWQVAGVHYYVGAPLTGLKNPSTISQSGVTVTSGQVTITGNDITLDGYDFGNRWVFVQGRRCRLVNCKGSEIASHPSYGNSADLYIGNCTLDGQSQTSFIVNQYFPGLTIENSWLKNAGSDMIGRHGSNQANYGGNLILRRNLIELAGMASGAHGDYLQMYAPPVDYVEITHNTTFQQRGTTQGFIIENTKDALVANNTMVTITPQGMSYMVASKHIGYSITNLHRYRDNYVDRSGAYGWAYPDAASPKVIFENNQRDLRTGATFTR